MLRIKNSHGAYWTGDHWGVVQAAEEYETVEDLPDEVDGADKWIHSTPKMGGFVDIRYDIAGVDADDDLEVAAVELSPSGGEEG